MRFFLSKLSTMMVSNNCKDGFSHAILWLIHTCTHYLELFPIWSASPRNNGGLGYRADEIGIALAYCGIVTLILQLFFLPKLTARFGVLRLYRFVLAGCIPLYFMQGYVRWFYEIPDLHGARQTKFWVWVGILVTATFRTCYHSISYTACTILVNNGAKRLNTLGTVNGFAQCKFTAAL